MAHEMALAMATDGNVPNENIIAIVWQYADEMQAEADKRKPSGLPEALKEEWQPDWSQAPSDFNWFFKQQDGSCHFSTGEPEFFGDAWAIEADSYSCESPISCPVDWQDSLRKRPQ